MSIQINFIDDSNFTITKIRSGGRISENELDFGTYVRKNDTLLLTNKSRRNKETRFIIDNEGFYQQDELPNYSFSQEYIKIEP